VIDCVPVKPAPEYLLPIAEVIPLQMFAYFMALERGVDVTGRGICRRQCGAGGILIRVSWTGLDFITLHNSN